MNLQTSKWGRNSLPDLNEARCHHSSCSFGGDQVYVACGRGNVIPRNVIPLTSVEMLRLGAQAWELINIPDLTLRTYPIISQIDFNNIVILGGNVKG